MLIRTGLPEDEGFVRDLAGEVFTVFGDYEPLLPRWFRAPGITTFVSQQGDVRTGYLMLGFFREGDHLVGDVLAIAVKPDWHNRGVGRTLLQHAITVCERMTDYTPIRALRLAVADSNAPARHLFTACGFVELHGDFGTYEGGQQALHMERVIDAQPPP